jgi:Zn-dependent peptidase ImmA (M78 family)
MLDAQSIKDIDKIVYDVLKNSKSLGVFPTPIDKIVSYSELICRSDIDITKIESSYLSKASDALFRAMSKVRGLLNRNTKEIYLDLSQLGSRQSFVKLHEVGHEIIPWQKKIHEFLDDDDTLDCETKEQFEAEANYFASGALFQLDRFIDEMKKLQLGLPSAMQLAKLFGSSTHAALRRYVECSRERCALIVLEKEPVSSTVIKYPIRNYFQSEKFTREFGEIKWPNELGYTWAFIQDYYFRRRHKTDGKFIYSQPTGDIEFEYHFFNNTYNAFVFIFPKGEIKTRRRSKVIITSPA